MFGAWENENVPVIKSLSPLPENEQWQLFDIQEDPSETIDLSAILPEVFNELKLKLEQHGTTASPALAYETLGDPNASPDLHNGYWTSWLH